MGGINGRGMRWERLVGGGGCGGGTLTPRSAVQTPQNTTRPANDATGQLDVPTVRTRSVMGPALEGRTVLGRRGLGMLVGGSWDCGETVSAVPPAIVDCGAAVSSFHDAREDHNRSGLKAQPAPGPIDLGLAHVKL
ncbi:hypothetical protein V496_10261, partial [Pseudogymnoascus sp. VKM F-4515 (FW-2607)]